VGLYARAVLPHLADPAQAYPALAALELPNVALGLFTLGMLATVMSTVDSYAFVAAVTLGRDLWWRLRGGDEDTVVPRATRIGLVLVAALSIAVALTWRDVISLWHDFGSVATPAMLVPTLTALFPRWRMRPAFAFASLVASAAVGAACLLVGKAHGGAYPLGLEPIYPALLTSLLVFALDRIRPRREPA
jgi:SSS family solute:Na+ symporter